MWAWPRHSVYTQGGGDDRYSALADLDGSGNVVAGDVSVLASHFGEFLPATDPSPPEQTTQVMATSLASYDMMPNDAGVVSVVSAVEAASTVGAGGGLYGDESSVGR